MKLPKRKTVNKHIKHVAINFLKLKRTFCKMIFCNVTRMSSIFFFADSHEKSLR